MMLQMRDDASSLKEIRIDWGENGWTLSGWGSIWMGNISTGEISMKQGYRSRIEISANLGKSRERERGAIVITEVTSTIDYYSILEKSHRE